MKWIKTTASSSISLHFIYNCRSISMSLWAPELLFVWLCYCILCVCVYACVCVCVCQQLTFQRPPAFTVTPDDNAAVHKLHTDFFPSLPTGITICFAQHKHNAIIRGSLWGDQIHFVCNRRKCSGDLTWQLLYEDKHFSFMRCRIFTCGTYQYQQHFTDLLGGEKKYMFASPFTTDESQ